MRTTQQVLDQLLAFANSHESIRAVTMNGSRVNPNAPKDFFCDFDVVYFSADPGPFLQDQSWIPYFGDLVILQQNDSDDHGHFTFIFLMLFQDGVRIDLYFNHLDNLAYLTEDTLTVVLLDKDGRIPPLPPPSDSGYYTPRPTQKEFAEAVNEIFWCSNNIAKGIWRDELAYVKAMYDVIVREPLLKLLAWYAAELHGWQVDSGKFGKWLKKYLPAEIWESYVRTYSGADYAETWAALFEALSLTRKIGPVVAQALGYPYPYEDDERTVAYLRQVQSLPPDATSFDGK
jgi:aminoglycoside 6-adenylyltransferase